MTDRLEITIGGTPAGRPRARSRAVYDRAKGKWVSRTYHPKTPKHQAKSKDAKSWAKANAWYDAVLLAVRPHLPPEPWSGPVHVTATVYFERPQRLCRKKDPDGPVPHCAPPDRDNLDKSILDALAHAGLFHNDSQVCQGGVHKWYAAKGYGPGVRIVAFPIKAPAADTQLPLDAGKEHP